jgi:hypothetical protein
MRHRENTMTGVDSLPTTDSSTVPPQTSESENKHLLNGQTDTTVVVAAAEPPADIPSEIITEEDVANIKSKLTAIATPLASSQDQVSASLYYEASTMAPLNAISLVGHHRRHGAMKEQV